LAVDIKPWAFSYEVSQMPSRDGASLLQEPWGSLEGCFEIPPPRDDLKTCLAMPQLSYHLGRILIKARFMNRMAWESLMNW